MRCLWGLFSLPPCSSHSSNTLKVYAPTLAGHSRDASTYTRSGLSVVSMNCNTWQPNECALLLPLCLLIFIYDLGGTYRCASYFSVCASYFGFCASLYRDRAGGALNVVLASAVRLLQYALAALLSVMLAVAVIDDGPLLHIQVRRIATRVELAMFRRLQEDIFCGTLLSSVVFLHLYAHLILPRQMSLHTLNCRFLRSDIRLEAREILCAEDCLLVPSEYVFSRLTENAVSSSQAFQQLHSVPFAWRQLAAPHPDDPSRPVSSVSPLFVGPRHQRLQNELCREFYSSRVVQFLEEMSGIILAPLVLGFCK